MKTAIRLAFGGSALPRAANLRARPADLAALASRSGAASLLFWQGKPLTCEGKLCFLPPSHPIFTGTDQIFLGTDEAGDGLFCAALADWPEGADPAPAEAIFDNSEQSHPELPIGTVFADLRRIMVALSPRAAELAATGRGLLAWHENHGFCARCGARSAISHAGWQRHCPRCGFSHFPRTDPVVIMLVTSGNDLLLGRAPAWPEGMYSLLAGFVEPGETIEAAVRREVAEETAVIVGPVDYVTSQPWPFPASLMLGCKGQALTRAMTLDPVEIEQALWVSRERLSGIFAGRDAEIRGARPGAIAHGLMWAWLEGRLD